MNIVILAGGTGRRLWPVSSKILPKQFIDIFGAGESLLQTAAMRAARVVGEGHVIVVTHQEYADIAREQLPWLAEGHLLAEPVHRNTCPAAAWAAHRVMQEEGDDGVVVFMPADQIILHEDRFEASLRQGEAFVKANDTVLTMGATPTRTEPGYGYIQFDGGESDNSGIYNIRSFVEKPEREFAKMLIESGEFLWNTGIYMGRVGYVREQFKALLPYVLRDMRGDFSLERDFIRENYSKYPNLSLDLAILEKMPVRSVMHCDFGWADIGTWHGIYEAMPNDPDDNVIVNTKSTVIADNAHYNVVALESGKLAILSGIEGMIVAERGNTLLICPKGDSSAPVRKFLAMVENM